MRHPLGGVARSLRRVLRVPDLPPASRMSRLGRMRLVATGLLVLMGLVFVAASLAGRRWPALLYVRAFAEAAMVGGCADWFAVTALFRRPFNLPIPHTGIVPRSKARIGKALGAFIADNFLTVDVLEARIGQLEVARWGARWLRRPANARRLARGITDLLPQLFDLSPTEARWKLIATAAGELVRVTPAAALAAGLLRAFWSEGRAQPFLELGLEALAEALDANRELIQAQVRGRTFRWMPRWLDRRIADRIIDGARELAREMRGPDHPWRVELEAGMGRFIERLETDPDLQARAESLKAALAASPLVAEHLAAVWRDLERQIRTLSQDRKDLLAAELTKAILSLSEWLDEDAAARETLNAWARAAARRLVAPQRHAIGGFIAGVVAAWDTRSIVERLELQVGPDLQYIRINGALVGGVVGVLIFALSRAFGLG